jgi:hypothetical protein
VSHPLLLDEMFAAVIAERLRDRGHDVQAVVADRDLVALPDDRILAAAATAGRAIVTANVKDFSALDQQCKAAGRPHGGMVLVSTKTFRQDRAFVGAVVAALDRLLAGGRLRSDLVIFLERSAG